MKAYSVYAIQNIINLKRYIGKAKDPLARWETHKREATLNKGYLLHAAIRKYGIENFSFEILKDFPSDEEAFNFERLMIKSYNSLVPFGYNITPGGSMSVTPEMSKKSVQTRRARGIKFGYAALSAEELQMQMNKTRATKFKRGTLSLKDAKSESERIIARTRIAWLRSIEDTY